MHNSKCLRWSGPSKAGQGSSLSPGGSTRSRWDWRLSPGDSCRDIKGALDTCTSKGLGKKINSVLSTCAAESNSTEHCND